MSRRKVEDLTLDCNGERGEGINLYENYIAPVGCFFYVIMIN